MIDVGERKNDMRSIGKEGKGHPLPLNDRWRIPVGLLLTEYTVVFAVFFVAVFSPFWLYGKSLFRGTDGISQYLPELTYSRSWAGAILNSLRQGRLEIPFWSLNLGLGQNLIGNMITYKPLNFLYGVFPREAVEQYAFIRLAIGLYLTGLAFLAYGWTRSHDRTHLILGAMIYVFSGFVPFYVTRHWLFMEMTFAFPLMLLGVDQIFDGKWSWLFILTVFMIGMSYFYTLFLITLPAVIYAVFHMFELDRRQRRRRGGFGRIFLRHVIQYLLGLCLAMVNLLPSLLVTLDSCRVSAQEDMNLFLWKPQVYLNYILGIVDARNIAYGGGILALPSAGLLGVLGLFFYRRKKDRLLLGQVVFYNLVVLLPVLTMLFSAFMGKTMRWFYVYTFWAALATVCVLPKIQRDGFRVYFFCACAFCVYALLYLAVCVWTGNGVSLSIVLEFVGLVVFCLVCLSDMGRERRGFRAAVIFLILLVELTTKSYERFSPQYESVIGGFINAGTVLDHSEDNAVSALKLAKDDGLYRVDSVMESATSRSQLANYGVRDAVYGVSSYHNLNSDRLARWSLGLGNSHQGSIFEVTDLAQRTALNTLAGVKYAVALEDATERVPYGYELVQSRKKTLSDGTETKACLYKNQYALPLAYAYDRYIDLETYEQLLPNQKEQAMLQGVVLEEAHNLEKADLQFDEVVLLDQEAICAELKQIAEADDNLEVADGVLRVKKANYTVSIPVEKAEGEIYLQFTGIHYESENYYWEEAERKRQNGDGRFQIIASERKARQWQPDDNAVLSVTCGNANDEVDLRNPSNQYYFGKRDVLLNLGYGTVDKKVKIKFSKPGAYSFQSVALICQPMDAYADKVAPLQANGAVSARVEGKRVTLEFKSESDTLACLTIPYSTGWSARVDGEPAEVVPANVAFMGVRLSKGDHTVEFSYTPSGLRLGAAISLGTLIAMIGIGVYQALRRRRSRG